MMINVKLLFVNWRNLMLGSVHKISLWVITLNTFDDLQLVSFRYDQTNTLIC